MGLFGGRGKSRHDSSQRSAAIADFWQWWTDEGMARSSSALADGEPSRIVAEMSSRVEAVSAELAWEFAKGDTSMHKLVVTADGDPALRSVARRWLEAAPEPDVFWAYADSRPPMVDLTGATIELDATPLALADVRVGVRRNGTRVDVDVFHPHLADLGGQARNTFCFLVVDAAVGEAMTETWIGELNPATVEPIDAFGLTGLRAVVRDLAAEFADAGSWVVLEGISQAGPVRVLARVPLAAASAPLLDQNVVVTVGYGAADDGLPDESSQSELEGFRTHLVDRLEGQGELVAMMMSAGRCQFHFYVDSQRTGAAQLSAAARAWPGKVTTDVEDDPGWANVAHLRG